MKKALTNTERRTGLKDPNYNSMYFPNARNMTMKGMKTPVKYYGITDGLITDEGIAMPGEDFEVNGQDTVEYRMQDGGVLSQGRGDATSFPEVTVRPDMVPANLILQNLDKPMVNRMFMDVNDPNRPKDYYWPGEDRPSTHSMADSSYGDPKNPDGLYVYPTLKNYNGQMVPLDSEWESIDSGDAIKIPKSVYPLDKAAQFGATGYKQAADDLRPWLGGPSFKSYNRYGGKYQQGGYTAGQHIQHDNAEERYNRIANADWSKVSPQDQEWYYNTYMKHGATPDADGTMVAHASLPEATVMGKRPYDFDSTPQGEMQQGFGRIANSVGRNAMQGLGMTGALSGEVARYVGGKGFNVRNVVPEMIGGTGNQGSVSKELGIQNPVGAFATDLLTDPGVLFGGTKAVSAGMRNRAQRKFDDNLYAGQIDMSDWKSQKLESGTQPDSYKFKQPKQEKLLSSSNYDKFKHQQIEIDNDGNYIGAEDGINYGNMNSTTKGQSFPQLNSETQPFDMIGNMKKLENVFPQGYKGAMTPEDFIKNYDSWKAMNPNAIGDLYMDYSNMVHSVQKQLTPSLPSSSPVKVKRYKTDYLSDRTMTLSNPTNAVRAGGKKIVDLTDVRPSTLPEDIPTGYNAVKLTPDEAHKVSAYTHGYDSSYNYLLRNKNNPDVPDDDITRAYYQDAETLNNMIQRNKLPEDIPYVYRNMENFKTSSGKNLSDYQPGDILEEQGFSSTTTSPDAFNREFKMAIENPGGNKQSFLYPDATPKVSHYYGAEDEALLPHGLKYQMTDRLDKHGNPIFTILNPYMKTGAIGTAGLAASQLPKERRGGRITPKYHNPNYYNQY